jgi:hypothetical protein
MNACVDVSVGKMGKNASRNVYEMCTTNDVSVRNASEL